MTKYKVKREFGRNEFGRRSKNLSNRIDGDTKEIILSSSKSVRSGLEDQFGLIVKNETAAPIRVAILPGHFDTAGYTFTPDGDGGGKVVENRSNPAQLIAAGYNVVAVADDGTYVDESGTKIVSFSAMDPTKTIRSFRDYLRTNPRPLTGMMLVSSDQNAFDSNVTVSSSTPFSRPGEKDVNLSTFFDPYQFQNDRIDIDFRENELEFSDICVVFATIQPDATMKFILRF